MPLSFSIQYTLSHVIIISVIVLCYRPRVDATRLSWTVTVKRTYREYTMRWRYRMRDCWTTIWLVSTKSHVVHVVRFALYEIIYTSMYVCMYVCMYVHTYVCTYDMWRVTASWYPARPCLRPAPTRCAHPIIDYRVRDQTGHATTRPVLGKDA